MEIINKNSDKFEKHFNRKNEATVYLLDDGQLCITRVGLNGWFAVKSYIVATDNFILDTLSGKRIELAQEANSFNVFMLAVGTDGNVQLNAAGASEFFSQKKLCRGARMAKSVVLVALSQKYCNFLFIGKNTGVHIEKKCDSTECEGLISLARELALGISKDNSAAYIAALKTQGEKELSE